LRPISPRDDIIISPRLASPRDTACIAPRLVSPRDDAILSPPLLLPQAALLELKREKEAREQASDGATSAISSRSRRLAA
jgi:hypothetical protein